MPANFTLSYQVPRNWPTSNSSTFYLKGVRIGVVAIINPQIPIEKSSLQKYRDIIHKEKRESVLEYKLVESKYFNGYWTKEVIETAKNEGYRKAWTSESDRNATKYTHTFLLEGKGLDVAIGVTCIDFESIQNDLLPDIALILETLKFEKKQN